MAIKAMFNELIEELRGIRTIELACLTANFLEKVFWTILGALGIAWAFYLVPSNVNIWMHNPSIISKGNLNLSQIQYPAITIKPNGITKYSIAEKLLNYLREDKLPNDLKEFRNILLKCATLQDKETKNESDITYYSSFRNECLFSFSFQNGEKFICEVR